MRAPVFMLVGTLAGIFPSVLWSSDEPVAATDFVKQRYVHGVPYSRALELDVDAVPALVAMVRSDTEKPYWSNTVITLGILGEDAGVLELIDFIEERFMGEVDLATFNAQLSVPVALGYAANRGNSKALEYLIENHTVDSWQAKQVVWGFQKYYGEQLSILLTKMVIQGLALSGRPEAGELLMKISSAPESAYVHLRQCCSHNVAEGQELFHRVEKVGLLRTLESSVD